LSGLPEIDLPTELEKLRRKGWIVSDREGDTGIGKTIEDHLGIIENPHSRADCTYKGVEVELKAHRVRTSSMITLFTLEAGVRNLNDVQMMQKYGYKDASGRRGLKVTLTTLEYVPRGLKLEATDTSITVVDKSGTKLWIWTVADIKLKLQNLCVIYCDNKTDKGKEYFAVQRAVLLRDLDHKRFFALVKSGVVKIDLRMHTKESGASRNHGTGFRIANFEALTECYRERTELLKPAQPPKLNT
jgi:hypothetical protein